MGSVFPPGTWTAIRDLDVDTRGDTSAYAGRISYRGRLLIPPQIGDVPERKNDVDVLSRTRRIRSRVIHCPILEKGIPSLYKRIVPAFVVAQTSAAVISDWMEAPLDLTPESFAQATSLVAVGAWAISSYLLLKPFDSLSTNGEVDQGIEGHQSSPMHPR